MHGHTWVLSYTTSINARGTMHATSTLTYTLTSSTTTYLSAGIRDENTHTGTLT